MSVVFSVVPVILLVLGFIGALLSYVIFPGEVLAGASFVKKMAAVAAFTFIYAVFLNAIIVIIVFVYNLFSSGLGIKGVTVEFNAIEQTGDLQEKQ
jgi:hypothetical protein